MSRALLEKSGYLKSFPHLLGCVCCLHGGEGEIDAAVARFEAGGDWTAVAVAVRPRADAGGLLPGLSDRRRARRRAAERLSLRCRLRLLPPRAVARARSPAGVPHARVRLHRLRRTASRLFARRWIDRAQEIAATSALPSRSTRANDPFFGRAGKLMAVNQVEPAAQVRTAHPGELRRRQADGLHELQLSPGSFRPRLGPPHRRRRAGTHRLRGLWHGPAGDRPVPGHGTDVDAWPARGARSARLPARATL